MNGWRRSAFSGMAAALIAACVCALAQPGSAAVSRESPAQTPEPKLEIVQKEGGVPEIGMEFYGLDIDHLLRLLMRAAGVTIIKSEQVSGPVTVIAPDPVPVDVAFQIVNSVLQVRGFTMMRTASGVYWVVPTADAVKAGTPMQFGDRPEDVSPSEALITQVIPLRNLTADDLAAEVEQLLPETARVASTATNSLIITDTAANIQRVMTLIADAESQLSGGFKVVPLQYYDATEMADLVDSFILGRGVGGARAARPAAWERRVTGRVTTPPRTPASARPVTGAAVLAAGPEFCYPDVRTNSLIVRATPVHLDHIADLVEQLDRPVSLRDSYFVYPVQNLVASDLAELVGPMIGAQVTVSGAGTEASGAGPTGRALPSTRTPYSPPSMRGTTPAPLSLRGTASTERRFNARTASLEVEPLAGSAGERSTASGLTVAQAPEVPVIPVQVAPLPEAPPPDIFVLSEEGIYAPPATGQQSTIVAEDNANLLLISAPPEQLDLIRQLLEELDVLPPQVYIRAIIAEVTLTRDTSLGFQWDSLGRTFGTFDGAVFTGDIGVGQRAAGSGDSPISSPGFYGRISGPEFNAVLTALTTDSHARILSAPSIFTSNNQQASINVSSSLPFPTGVFTSTTTTDAISTSINYQPVGIVLNVTPRVTQGNIVQMQIAISANEPGPSVTVAGQEYPSTNAREAEATLNVQHGETVVLGGLMRDQIIRSAERVPILGDLPIIGTFFRSTSSRRTKSELLVFLTPHVVRSAADAAQLTESEKSRLPEVPRSLRRPADASTTSSEGERR